MPDPTLAWHSFREGAEHAMQELVGRRIGQYELIEVVGRGGMATVYKAYQESLDRVVAVKVLADLGDPSFVQRFQREARAVAALQHRNIIQLYDHGEQDGTVYLVLQFVEGGHTLADMMGTPLPPTLAATLGAGVLGALGYAHQRRIVHRDVKPSNVLLPEQDWPLLTDFGIAKLLLEEESNLTATGRVMGTAKYMAPEQGLGLAVDGRADVYAMGIVLHEMLTGQVPFSSDTPSAAVLQHAYRPVPPIREISPAMPPELEAMILRALAKEPADRYPRAEDMAAELRALLPALSNDPLPTLPRGESAYPTTALLQWQQHAGGGEPTRPPGPGRFVAVGEAPESRPKPKAPGRPTMQRLRVAQLVVGAAMIIALLGFFFVSTRSTRRPSDVQVAPGPASEAPAVPSTEAAAPGPAAPPPAAAPPGGAPPAENPAPGAPAPAPEAPGPQPQPQPEPQQDPPPTAPAEPTALRAETAGTDRVALRWRDNADDETAYEVYNGSQVQTLPAGTTSFTWTGLAPGTQACFQVRAVNAVGPSVLTDQACAATSPDAAAFTVPASVTWVNTGLEVTEGQALRIDAEGSWASGPGGATGPDGYEDASSDNFLNVDDLGVCGSCSTTAMPGHGALIGYIGTAPPQAGSYRSEAVLPEAERVFVVGSSFDAAAPGTGTLWLAVNADAYTAHLSDNSGAVTATVSLP